MTIEDQFKDMVDDIVSYLWDVYRIKPIDISIDEDHFSISWYTGATHSLTLLYNNYNSAYDDFILIKYTNDIKTQQLEFNNLTDVFNQIIVIINRTKPLILL